MNILCACCSTCPDWWDGDKYLDAVLMKALRWIDDCRDEMQNRRIEYLNIVSKCLMSYYYELFKNLSKRFKSKSNFV